MRWYVSDIIAISKLIKTINVTIMYMPKIAFNTILAKSGTRCRGTCYLVQQVQKARKIAFLMSDPARQA
uniref:Uncharacterized protein n=1 Tax=Meloidogyne incognita TaxID=6306 RepID=A0A914KLJ1_MELIC